MGENDHRAISRHARFVVTGAQGTGKGKLVRGLARKHSLVTDEGMPKLPEGVALGTLADYRIETLIAVHRCMAHLQPANKSVIYEHSLVDSLAYVSTRCIRLSEMDGVDYAQEKWASVLGVTASFLRDSFRIDHVFFLKGADPEQAEIEDGIIAVLEAFGIAHTELAANKHRTNLELVSHTIEGYLSESG
jgi:hypothetical protein